MLDTENPAFKPYAQLKTRIQRVPLSATESLRVRTLADHMQYADPHGHAQQLGIGSAVWPLFGLIWPSSIQLARKLKNRPVRPQEKILELGCGLGLASLLMHRRGAQVHASDCHPLASHFLETNQALNGLSGLPYVHAQWGEPACPDLLSTLGLTPAHQRYDLIVGSDLLYERSTPALLADLVHQRAKAQAEVWIVDPDRGHRNRFTQEMAQYGFKLMWQVCLRDRPILTAEGEELAYKGRCLQYRRD
ncbi:class I SAM-dependent methyltransferase [Mesopusillimonas faecipullorum]|uniref:class I SAM-dependent methyltransferase n=1 Tax=Mesopusillimonas faecipullorum TaxID=2755040 RepID=UPI001D027E1F|nr:protein N-lysine methyltransferase family protein [Mesopusillimonas faecipullorum]